MTDVVAGHALTLNREGNERAHAAPPLFAPHRACLIADVRDGLSVEIQLVLDHLSQRGCSAKVLAIPQGQSPADLRSMPYVHSEQPAVVNVRHKHAPMVIDPLLFRGAMVPLQSIWSALDLPGAGELLTECVKHEARVYVATTWNHLLPAAVAAAYHDATLLFMPDEQEFVRRPVVPGSEALISVLHEQLVPSAVRQVLVPTAPQAGPYSAIFDGRISDLQTLSAPPHALPERTRLVAELIETSAIGATRRNYLDEHHGMGATLAALHPESHPLLSISVPTFNRAPLLVHTLSSVCAQAARYGLEALLEIVVSDNDSSDHTLAMLSQLAQHTRVPVRYHRNATNMGVGLNVVHALDRARGEFCCVLGDDDFLVEGTLPRLLHALLAPRDVALVIFRAHAAPFPYTGPTRISMQDVARDWFYHIGNLGLAVVRREHYAPALASRDWNELQRFWPQTQTYFHAMLSAAGDAPALAVPEVVVFHPLHRILTTYTGRYLWDEGFFSLFDVALRLQPAMPAWFMPTLVAHYFVPRGDAITAAMINEYAATDTAAHKQLALHAMRDALQLCMRLQHRLGPDAGRVLERISVALLRYAAPTTADSYAQIVGILNDALPDDATSASVSAASHAA